MADKNWSQIGDDIESMVRSALESQDFGKLSESLAQTADDALSNVERSVQKAMDMAHEKMGKYYTNTEKKGSGEEKDKKSRRSSSKYVQFGQFKAESGPYGESKTESGGYQQFHPESVRNQSDYNKNQKSQGRQLFRERYRSTASMSSTGIVLTACGYSFLGILLIVWGIILAVALSTGHGTEAFITTAVMSPFIAGSGFMAYKGTALLTRTRRFRRYVEVIREREYCQIRELADTLGKSESFVKKDLSKMIKKRLFYHGHLDRKQTCLMVTDDAYRQYQTAEKQLEEREKEEKEKAAAAGKFGQRKDLSEEAKKVIADGKQYLEEIRRCNSRIPGEDISEKISRLELVISKIFNRVEQHPELVDDLGRFMDYYLPTTLKLLKAYEELDAQPVQGENIRTSKKQIEDSLDIINQAFEKLLDSFFEEAAWDISSDISVLHNMFAQEGLTESELDKIKLKL